jgi:hypothetical protein
VAISNLSGATELHTYAFNGWADDIRHSMYAHGVTAHVTEISEEVVFSYFHPLSQPRMRPPNVTTQPSLKVDGDVVIRFGLLEGDAIVRARMAIYDPQSAGPYVGFRANGSTAERLCVVLNEYELRSGTTQCETHQAASAICKIDEAEVVIVKRGPAGALVLLRGHEPSLVPAYRSEEVFKIGTGDIFTAAFSHYWADRNLAGC